MISSKKNIYSIPYGEKQVSFIDEADEVIFYAQPDRPAILPDPQQLIQQALDYPVNSPRLEQLVENGNRIAILIDDVTRPTPRKQLVEAVVQRLSSKTCLEIRLIYALGTHRTMTDEEIAGDLGELAQHYQVVNIDYRDESRFDQVGVLPDLAPIQVYREILDADVIIGIGNIVPHIAAGWGGGAKIIMPGVCSKVTTDAVHMISFLKQNLIDTCGTLDNPFRKAMEDLAAKVNLTFIVNTVLDPEKNIIGVVAGDFIQAHWKGVDLARKILCPKIPRRADLLIVSANPADMDFWQGAKPYIFAHAAVKPGGVIVFLLSGKEGLCGSAPAHECAIRHYYNKSEAEVRAALDSGEVEDVLGVGEAFIRIHSEGICRTILISDGLTEEDAALLGFEKSANLTDAIAVARTLIAGSLKIGIIPYGGETLCRVQAE